MQNKILNFSIIFLFLLLAFALPILWRYVMYPLALIAVLSVIGFLFKKDKKKFFNKNEFLKHPLILFFLLSVLSLIYSSDIIFGWKIIEVQLSLFFLPLTFIIYTDIFNANYKKWIFKIFLIGIIFSISFNVGQFFLNNDYLKIFDKINSSNFYNYARHFELVKYQHVSYYSMYLVWGIVLMVFFINKHSFGNLFFGSLFIILSLGFVIILSSRAALLTLVFLFIYYGTKFLSPYSKFLIIAFYTILIIASAVFIQHTRFNKNLEAIKKTDNIEEVDIRISLWKHAFIVWKEKPIFGYGIGDAKARLIEVHKQRNLEAAHKIKLNAHNQFLETATQTGAIGLIVLLLVFIIPLYQFVKKKQELLFLFLIITFINFLFESMLQTLAGVSFFAFWYSFLYFVYYKNEGN